MNMFKFQPFIDGNPTTQLPKNISKMMESETSLSTSPSN